MGGPKLPAFLFWVLVELSEVKRGLGGRQLESHLFAAPQPNEGSKTCSADTYLRILGGLNVEISLRVFRLGLSSVEFLKRLHESINGLFRSCISNPNVAVNAAKASYRCFL